jgi:imidazolonepropionase-like amidohydrolase
LNRFALLALALAAAAADPGTFAIRQVTVIDVENGQRLGDRTVVVAEGRIRAVGPSGRVRLPAGARVVEGRGRYLIPGLWDMHTHVCNDSDTYRTAPSLLIAHGVTGVRDMAGPLRDVLLWREETRAGRLLGPRAVVSGPLIDGAPPATDGDITVRSVEEGRRAVDSLANAGVDFIKAYEMLRPDTYAAIVDQAHRRHLPVAGHLPLAVDAFEASALGVVSFEHLRNLELACSRHADSLRAARIATLDSSLALPGRSVRSQVLNAQRPIAMDSEDPARRDSLFRALAKNGTWQVPTLFLDEVALTLADSVAMQRVLAAEPYVSKEVADWWRQQRAGFLAAPAESRERAQRHARWLRDYVPRLRDAGVGILAGTDMPNLLTAAGFSLHEELRTLRDAGLSNLEALRSATIAPARFLGALDSLGTVERGKVADLVLLDADPLADIGNTSRIRAVVVRGRLLERADLDRLLAGARRAARGE